MNWRQLTDRIKRNQTLLKLGDLLGRGRGQLRWLDELNPPPPARIKPDLSDWEQRELSAVWIGHATVLLRIAGMTILTDPVFANRIGLGLWLGTLGTRRYVAAALKPSELPKIDLLLQSHVHFDHLDRQSLAMLPRPIEVVTAPKTSDLLKDLGYRPITELAWDQQVRVKNVTITARRVVHWGARTFLDRHRGYNAYLIEGAGRRILFGGDTAMQDRFNDIGGVDLAILGIAAYDPYIAAHATPEQAWEMAQQMGARALLPIHHSTFRLSHEAMDEPMKRMLAAAGDQADRIVIREPGGSWTLK